MPALDPGCIQAGSRCSPHDLGVADRRAVRFAVAVRALRKRFEALSYASERLLAPGRCCHVHEADRRFDLKQDRANDRCSDAGKRCAIAFIPGVMLSRRFAIFWRSERGPSHGVEREQRPEALKREDPVELRLRNAARRTGRTDDERHGDNESFYCAARRAERYGSGDRDRAGYEVRHAARIRRCAPRTNIAGSGCGGHGNFKCDVPRRALRAPGFDRRCRGPVAFQCCYDAR